MRSVIWDLGGTLVDTYPDVDRALATVIDPQPDAALLHEVARLTRRSSSEAIDTLAACHGIPPGALRGAYEGTKRQWAEHPAPAMDGAREVLDAVRAGGGLNLVATHRDRASATALIDDLGLAVDDLVCAPDGLARKPSPEMIRTLLDRHHLNAEECLAVGDRPADVQAARGAGVEGVLLETPETLLDAGEARRVSALRELLDLLDLLDR